MAVGKRHCLTALGSPFYIALLQQVGLDHILYGIPVLAKRCANVVESYRAAVEPVDNEPEIVLVMAVEAAVVNALHVEGPDGQLLVIGLTEQYSA